MSAHSLAIERTFRSFVKDASQRRAAPASSWRRDRRRAPDDGNEADVDDADDQFGGGEYDADADANDKPSKRPSNVRFAADGGGGLRPRPMASTLRFVPVASVASSHRASRCRSAGTGTSSLRASGVQTPAMGIIGCVAVDDCCADRSLSCRAAPTIALSCNRSTKRSSSALGVQRWRISA